MIKEFNYYEYNVKMNYLFWLSYFYNLFFCVFDKDVECIKVCVYDGILLKYKFKGFYGLLG